MGRFIHESVDKTHKKNILLGDLKRFLLSSKKEHMYVEDSHYSCPMAEDGCSDDRVEKDKCNCGADEFNNKVDELLAKYDWLNEI